MRTGFILVTGREEENIQTKNKNQSQNKIRQSKYKLERRLKGVLQRRRVPNNWPSNQDFRILSIDGGGIKGIFPACFLEKLELNYLEGKSIIDYFDLICGTSTGGIIALGLGSGVKASELSKLYIERGNKIFPYKYRWLKKIQQCVYTPYNRKKLKVILEEIFKDKKLKESKVRLCVPSFEGVYSEAYVFKTPHHLDFKKDGEELMTKVAFSTSAAPAFLRSFKDNGYIFIDGGVWANNPCMIGLVEALSSFNVQRENIKILSIGCGENPYVVENKMITGGLWHWRKIIKGAMHLQSQNAVGQAGLLIGSNNILRVDVPESMMPKKGIDLDDWKKSVTFLPIASEKAFIDSSDKIKNIFLKEPTIPYKPFC